MSVISGFGLVTSKLVNILFNSKDYLRTVFTVLLLGIVYPHWGEELVRLSPRQSQLDAARANQRGAVATCPVEQPQRDGWDLEPFTGSIWDGRAMKIAFWWCISCIPPS